MIATSSIQMHAYNMYMHCKRKECYHLQCIVYFHFQSKLMVMKIDMKIMWGGGWWLCNAVCCGDLLTCLLIFSRSLFSSFWRKKHVVAVLLVLSSKQAKIWRFMDSKMTSSWHFVVIAGVRKGGYKTLCWEIHNRATSSIKSNWFSLLTYTCFFAWVL